MAVDPVKGILKYDTKIFTNMLTIKNCSRLNNEERLIVFVYMVSILFFSLFSISRMIGFEIRTVTLLCASYHNWVNPVISTKLLILTGPQ